MRKLFSECNSNFQMCVIYKSVTIERAEIDAHRITFDT